MSKNILIVDEDYHTVEMAKLILKAKGYEATGCTDGAEGWELLKKIQPDLAIIEMRMPGMSAIEFCKRVRREPEVADTPILITSGLVANSDKSDSFWAKGLGADDFLLKPYDPLGLLSRVEYLLRKGNYVSHGARPTTTSDLTPPPDPEDLAAEAETAELLLHAGPGEVVRMFIESWNFEDFGTEYDCLGSEMLGGMERPDYIQRRQQLYSTEGGAQTQHNVVDFDAEVTGETASVACLREDVTNGNPRRKDERYKLKLIPAGWKIVGVQSRPITFVIE